MKRKPANPGKIENGGGNIYKLLQYLQQKAASLQPPTK